MAAAASDKRRRLRRSDCSTAGIARRRQGRGFTYRDANGEPVTDEETIARIKDLVIPPAWTDVWICPDPTGHIQATGFDAAGRKQYLYHDRWQRRAAQRKFEQVREFAAALPHVRRVVSRDLDRDGLPPERAVACAVRLLDLGFFRIGGEAYAESNESYGIATILREHVTISGKEIVFDFPGKSGQRRVQSVRDEPVRKALEAMRRRRSGPDDLLVYRDRREWRDVRSADVNDYIQAAAGEEFSAKDFRTWHGTVLAAVELARLGAPRSKNDSERAIKGTVKIVAERLGNTPAVCRRSYVDPRLLDRYREGETIDLPQRLRDGRLSNRQRDLIERRVRRLLT